VLLQEKISWEQKKKKKKKGLFKDFPATGVLLQNFCPKQGCLSKVLASKEFSKKDTPQIPIFKKGYPPGGGVGCFKP